VNFTAAGQHLVTGETVTAKTAGSGSGEIKVTSPVASTSGKAVYKLLCGGSSVGGVTVTAAVTPAARTASCATAAPSFTATGSIEASKAERVTYYWAQSNDRDSAPATLTFTGQSTRSAAPSTTLPPSSPGNSGGGTLALSATGVTGPWPLGQQFPGATVTVSGGQAPYTWYTSGLLDGMTATPEGTTLAIGGTPTELGNFTIAVTVADSAKPQDAGSYRLPFEVAEIQAQPQGR
jgi:hypothetical protein